MSRNSETIGEDGIVFATGPWEAGGETATSLIPSDYTGPCAVIPCSGTNKIGIFRTTVEAMQAARVAIQPDGGYGSVKVECADSTDVNYETWEDWYF